MHVNPAECIAAGLDPDKVEAIARRISSAAKDARKLGLEVFGGSGSGTLRQIQSGNPKLGALVVADLDGPFNGGDGGTDRESDGLERGEV